MANGKIEFALGSLTFSSEGEEKWVAAQLDKVLAAAPGLQTAPTKAVATGGSAEHRAATSGSSGSFTTPLGKYIKEKGGDTKQVERFLATSDWLRRRGTGELTTASVTKALSSNHQKGLGNPADCLNKNISKGFCEKKDNGFFITPDGLAHLGHGE